MNETGAAPRQGDLGACKTCGRQIIWVGEQPYGDVWKHARPEDADHRAELDIHSSIVRDGREIMPPCSCHGKGTLRQRPEDQPLPTPGRDDVQETLITQIRTRRQLGILRYGSPLMTHNGRDALQDAQEEAIDLAAYLTQARMEWEDTKKAVELLDKYLQRYGGTPGSALIESARELLTGGAS